MGYYTRVLSKRPECPWSESLQQSLDTDWPRHDGAGEQRMKPTKPALPNAGRRLWLVMLMRAVTLVSALACMSCSNQLTAPVGCEGWPEVTLLSIEPPSGTTLGRNTHVKIEATFRYRSCRDGRVSFLVQDQSERSVPLLPDAAGFIPNVRLPVGSGTATLTGTVIVPSTPTSLSLRGRFEYIGIWSGSTDVFAATYVVQ